jgi:hypothetical protein
VDLPDPLCPKSHIADIGGLVFFHCHLSFPNIVWTFQDSYRIDAREQDYLRARKGAHGYQLGDAKTPFPT